MMHSEKRLKGTSRAAISKYKWLGKVSELNNVIQRAVVSCEGPIIEATYLNIQIKFPCMPEFGAGEQDHIAESRPTISLEEYFQHFVLSHQDQMSETELSSRLGINRKSLLERRNRLRIPEPK